MLQKLNTEGWSVKGVKSGEHTRGCWFYGNLYRGTRKVGSFEEHGNGAPMDIYFVDDDQRSDFQSLADMYDDEYSSMDILISAMVDEYELVKKIRRDRKKRTYYDEVDPSGREVTYSINQPYSESLVRFLLSKADARVVRILNEEFDIYPDGVERVYREEDS